MFFACILFLQLIQQTIPIVVVVTMILTMQRPSPLAVGTDSDVAASKTDTTDHSVIVSLTDEQQLQAFAFLSDHPFMWDKTDLIKYKRDKKRRQEYWQKLADLIGITCK